MMSQTHPIRAIGLTAALTVATGLAACAPTPFTVNPELADEEIAVGAASVNPLLTDEEFQAALGGYPIIRDAASNSVTIPGIYGAYGLAKGDDGGFTLQRGDHFTPQGLAISSEYVFVSAYDYDHELNSVIFVLDFDGNFVKTISLDNRAHVGGIGYDHERDFLWVGDKRGGHAVISGIDLQEIKDYEITDGKPIAYDGSLYVDTLPNTSTLTFAGDILWAGNFTNEAEESQLQLFSLEFEEIDGELAITQAGDPDEIYLSESGDIHIVADAAFRAPKEVQGLAFNGQYLYLAQSFGTQEAKLTRYKPVIGDDTVTFADGTSVDMPPYLQQIALIDTDEINYIFPLFESSQRTYRKKVEVFVDRIVGFSAESFEEASYPDLDAVDLEPIPVKKVEE